MLLVVMLSAWSLPPFLDVLVGSSLALFMKVEVMYYSKQDSGLARQLDSIGVSRICLRFPFNKVTPRAIACLVTFQYFYTVPVLYLVMYLVPALPIPGTGGSRPSRY